MYNCESDGLAVPTRSMIYDKRWTKAANACRVLDKYTKREVEIMSAQSDSYTDLEKDKLMYYSNRYNANGEVVVPYGQWTS